MAESAVVNPILLIDEIDKAAGDARFNPMGPFYSLLEPHYASRLSPFALRN